MNGSRFGMKNDEIGHLKTNLLQLFGVDGKFRLIII